jgi:inosose dehydratase
LESAGYRGWYVMEQDCALTGEPAAGAGPAGSVRRSLDFLATLDS